METAPFLTEFLIILVIATLAAITFERFRLSSILGFLLSGVIIGPHGLGLLTDSDRIHQLAEIGVVLLMLTIGLEFSYNRFRGMQKLALAGGGLQILISIAIGLGFAWWRGWTPYEGFFLGSVIALSSTAIVLKHLIDRGELHTQHGRIAVAILIFQDLAIVPLMIFVTGPAQSGTVWQALGLGFLKTGALLAGLFGFSRYVLPRLLPQLAAGRNRDIFFLSAVVFCLGTAWLGGQLGLSLAIGAFFAGFMLANTDYAHQLIGDITPFRHVFVSIFFVSIGMLFDASYTLDNLPLVILVVGLVLLVNFVVITALVMAFGLSPRVALASGILLSQIGEFSFLLIEAAQRVGGIDMHFYNLLLSTAFITMLISPLLFAMVPAVLRISENVTLLGSPPSERRGEPPDDTQAPHVIICGFGACGRDLAHTFRDENIPFVLVEMSPEGIRAAKREGINVIYGDAANSEVMRRAGIQTARAVIVSFADPVGMEQIARVIHAANPATHLIVRTRFEEDVPRLQKLGVDYAVVEELEASHEINRAVLNYVGIPGERIGQHLDRILTRKQPPPG